MLTPNQLAHLKEHLDTLDIEFDETFHEILDHYASLTEDFMATGDNFDTARERALVWLGGNRQINHIEDRYYNIWYKHITNRHKQILRECFRWPHLVTTVLLCILTYKLFIYVNILQLAPFLWVLNFLLQQIIRIYQSWPRKFTKANVLNLITFRKKSSQRISIRTMIIRDRMNSWYTGFWLVYLTHYLLHDWSESLNTSQEYGFRAILVAIFYFSVVYLFSVIKLYYERPVISR